MNRPKEQANSFTDTPINVGTYAAARKEFKITARIRLKRVAISLTLMIAIVGIFASVVVSHGQLQSSEAAQSVTLAQSPSTNSPVYDVVVQRNAPMKTRDGVTLFGVEPIPSGITLREESSP